MTEQATPGAASAPPPPVLDYISIWAQSLAGVLAQIGGAAFPVESLSEKPAQATAAEATDLQVIVTAAGGLRGEMSLRLPPPVALALGQLFLSEAQDAAAEFKSDHKEAIEELLRQVAGYVVTALKPRWGEVQFRLESGTVPSWPPGASGWIASSPAVPFFLCLEWQVSAALQAALAAAAEAQSGATPEEHPAAGEAGPGNLDLLLGVELEAMLRFGARSMLLREILELGAGSVVELDREIEEPVDLLLDNTIIARGEVVVIDGNYGLRVLEVLPPQDRLQSRKQAW